MNFIFCLQINVKVFFTLIFSFRYVARNAQITQSSKFAISLQYNKKEVIDEIDFLHQIRMKACCNDYTMILIGMV